MRDLRHVWLGRIFLPVLLLLLVGAGPVRAADVGSQFAQAKKRLAALRADPVSVNRRDLWQALDARLAQLAQAAAKDKALRAAILYYQAWTNEELAKRSLLDRDYETAVGLYARVVATAPPGSIWADDALLRRAMILINQLKRPEQARDDLRRLLARHPQKRLAKRAGQLLAGLGREAPPAPKAPASPPAQPATTGHPASFDRLALTKTATGTRLTLSLDRETRFHYQLLEQTRPSGEPVKRLYIDLDNTRLGARIPSEKRYESGNVSRLRAGYYTPDTVRVVMELDDVQHYDVHAVAAPFRVILELTAAPKSGPDRAKVRAPKPADKDAAKQPDTPAARRQPAAPSPTKHATATLRPGKAGKKRLGDLVEQLGLTVHTVMIDPGHGGKDPGAHGMAGLVEKNVNLRFAKILGKALKQRGLRVLYTRTSDVFIPLEKRTQMANDKGADLFISIHCNAHSDPGTSGLETYSLNLANSQDAVRVAARENASSHKTISDLQAILTDLMLSAKTIESRDLAGSVQRRSVKSLSRRFGTRDRGPHEAPFFVLIGANMPAVLVELGYITNPADAKRLSSDAYLRDLAHGMVNGIMAYKRKIERYATL